MPLSRATGLLSPCSVTNHNPRHSDGSAFQLQVTACRKARKKRVLLSLSIAKTPQTTRELEMSWAVSRTWRACAASVHSRNAFAHSRPRPRRHTVASWHTELPVCSLPPVVVRVSIGVIFLRGCSTSAAARNGYDVIAERRLRRAECRGLSGDINPGTYSLLCRGAVS